MMQCVVCWSVDIVLEGVVGNHVRVVNLRDKKDARKEGTISHCPKLRGKE